MDVLEEVGKITLDYLLSSLTLDNDPPAMS
jgi:hypothetical protein